jgi:hypothetical protein
MKASTAADRIEGLIITGSDTFAGQIVNIQDDLYNRLVVALKDVALDPQGYIEQSAANRKVLSDATDIIDQAFGDGSRYQSAVEGQLSIIGGIDDINQAYFETISSAFVPNRVFINNLRNNIVADLETTLLNDGIQAAVKNPLINILNRNISVGGSYSGFLQELKTYITGTEGVEARLLKYTRTYLSDALFQYARAYQESVTADLGLDWYVYTGGIIHDSREFCRDRNGGYFHRKEIESWADLEWQGKNSATTKSSIFILLGGWACRHSLIPVHISAVPEEWISRARDLGYID